MAQDFQVVIKNVNTLLTILDLWTWEEDQMLDTREINKVIQKRGLKSVNERVEFLSGN